MGTIVLISCFNFLMLGRYYIYDKRNVLLDTYKVIDEVSSDGNINTEDFSQEISKIAKINNIEVLILDSENRTIITTAGNEKILTARLLDYIFKGTDNYRGVYSDDKVQIQMGRLEKEELEYLELWGVLSSSNLIIMRTPVQSMKEASIIANKIFLIIGIAATLIGFVVIWFISKSLTKPIMNLVNISEKMTKLDFGQKYSGGKGNEIDILGNHINILSENLEKTIGELKSANIELKKDIDRRTEIDEMRKEFISNASHELKTPIALIQGYAEGLKDCVNDDADSRDFYCDVIIDEADKMNRLVRNLLELTELEAGNNVTMEHFDIVEMIHNCVASLEVIARGENVEIQIDAPADGLYVWSDEFMVEHVLNNYLSNAIHYVDDNKVIKVSVIHIDNNVRVSVYNSGEQIPEDIIDNIWVKFYKADKARTREYGGSGIGLSIVKAIMESLGHDYGVNNCEHGVEFWFEVDANENTCLFN